MTHTKCILCPVDFSECSRHALDCAVGLARLNKAPLVVLHVFAQWPAVDVVPSLQITSPGISLKDVDRDVLTRCLKEFVGTPLSELAETDVRVIEAPDVQREILAQADALNAGLIVIGSHGRSGFERLLLGSTTERVLRDARCPVMLVPQHADLALCGSTPHRARRGASDPVQTI
jgi:nucleotide-binding universal stress UspA family protein